MTKENFTKLVLVFTMVMYPLYELCSQNVTVKGRVSINAGDFYYVSVQAKKDSVIIDYRYFDAPDFIMEGIKQKNFILRISSPLLYKPYSQTVSCDSVATVDVGLIQLEPDVMSLDEVTIVATPPNLKFTEGKMVYNIQNNTDFKHLTSLDDVLRRIPFLSISENKIDVFGRKNTIILVNGLPPKNTNWELLSSDNIKEIEVITNPSAEYNASGMAVVNIITRQAFIRGFNGQITSTVSKGDFWRLENSLQLGYATDKFNIYGSANYNPNKRNFIEKYGRDFPDGSQMYNTIIQKRNTAKNHNAVLGFDYIPHFRHIIGVQYQNFNTHPTRRTTNVNNLRTNSITETVGTNIDGDFKNFRNIYDLSYTFQVDSIGKKLSVNMGYVDYSSYENNTITVLHDSRNTDKSSCSEADITLYTVNADYTHKTKQGITGKAGVCFSRNKNNSYYNMQDGTESYDSGKAAIESYNGVDINEDKFSGYVSLRRQWSDIHITAGVRYEYVNYENRNKQGENYTKTYNDFFPSLEVGYKVNERLQTNLSFSRKVLYPAFQDLDPSMHYVDPFTYYVGNMNLRPEYSYNIGLDFVYNKFVNVSLAYNKIQNPLTSFFVKRLEPDSPVCLAMAENLDSQHIWTASASVPFQYKNWTMQNSVGVTFNSVTFRSENIPMKRKRTMVYLYTSQGFRFPADFNLFLTYQYNSAGVNGIFYHSGNHVMNCALSKSLMKGQMVLSLKYDDMLNSRKQKVWTQMHDIGFSQELDFDSSFISLSIMFKFGKSKSSYQMKENSKKELQRIK